MDYPTLGWVLLGLLWLALALYVISLVRRIWHDELVRCPQTNAVTLIRIQRVAQAGAAPVAGIERCGLWPEHQDCARNCLAHRSEWPRAGIVKGRSLQPF